MKIYITTLVLLLAFGTFAQIDFKTGDASLETELNLINKEAKNDLGAFKTQLSTNYQITIPKLDNLLDFMQPAEIELSLRIGKIANVSIDRVVESYRTNKDKGWGVIAKEMGIKPGSAEFHALKGKPKKNKNHPTGKGNSKGKGKSK